MLTEKASCRCRRQGSGLIQASKLQMAKLGTPGFDRDDGLEVVKNHPLLPWVRSYLQKHKFPSVENGQLKGALNPDFFPDIIILPPNPVFLAKPTVQDFYWGNTRVVICAPDVYYNRFCPGGKVPCPRCKRSASVGPDGWENDMRLVHGIACTFLYAKRYRCKDCAGAKSEGGAKTTSFNALNLVSLSLLPSIIKQQQPFRITHRGALHQSLVDLVDRDVLNGKSFLDEQDMLKELAYLNYYRAQLLSLSYENAQQELRKKQGQLHFAAPKPLEAFSRFSDPEGYRGRLLSASYLTQVYKDECEDK
jgi:hypothetical protein